MTHDLGPEWGERNISMTWKALFKLLAACAPHSTPALVLRRADALAHAVDRAAPRRARTAASMLARGVAGNEPSYSLFRAPSPHTPSAHRARRWVRSQSSVVQGSGDVVRSLVVCCVCCCVRARRKRFGCEAATLGCSAGCVTAKFTAVFALGRAERS